MEVPDHGNRSEKRCLKCKNSDKMEKVDEKRTNGDIFADENPGIEYFCPG